VLGSEETRLLFLLGYPVTILATLLFGAGPGLTAAAISSLLPAYFILSPIQSVWIDDPVNRNGMFAFFGVNVLIAYTIQALIDAKQAAEAYACEREHAQTIAEAYAAQREAARESAEIHANEHKRLRDELAHRLNNVSMSLLAQADIMARATQLAEVKEALMAFRARIRAVNLVHQLLAEEPDPEAPVDARSFIKGLIDKLQSAAGTTNIQWEIEVESHPVPRTWINTLGSVIAELAINALKHAFPKDRPGVVWVKFWRDGQDYILVVEDDGVGVQTPHSGADLRAYVAGKPAPGHPTLGFGNRFLVAYARALGGKFKYGPREAGEGTCCSVRFPVVGKRVS
jgi:two-component sensor histidine kinase